MTSPGGAEVVFPMLSRTKTIFAGATWMGEPGHEVFGRPNRMSNQPGFSGDDGASGWRVLVRCATDWRPSEPLA